MEIICWCQWTLCVGKHKKVYLCHLFLPICVGVNSPESCPWGCCKTCWALPMPFLPKCQRDNVWIVKTRPGATEVRFWWRFCTSQGQNLNPCRHWAEESRFPSLCGYNRLAEFILLPFWGSLHCCQLQHKISAPAPVTKDHTHSFPVKAKPHVTVDFDFIKAKESRKTYQNPNP